MIGKGDRLVRCSSIDEFSSQLINDLDHVLIRTKRFHVGYTPNETHSSQKSECSQTVNGWIKVFRTYGNCILPVTIDSLF
jgi:hypothetical protein